MKKNLLLATVALLFINSSFLFGQQNPVGKNVNATNASKLNSKQVLLSYKDENTNLFGFKDSVTDKVVIQAKYTNVYQFSEGLAAVNIGGTYEYNPDGDDYFSGGKWGYINTSGVVVIPFKYFAVSDFNKGIAIIKDYSKIDSSYLFGLINSKGFALTPAVYSEINTEENGYFTVQKNGLWGFIYKTGKEVIPCKYNDINFTNGCLIVTLDKKQGLLDITGKEIIPIINRDVYLKDEYGFFWIIVDDKNNYYYHKSGLKFDTRTDFEDGVAKVSLNRKFGLIDNKAHFILPFKYDYINYFHHGTAIVELNGKFGHINTLGIEKVPCKYDKIYIFEKGRAFAILNNKQGYVDTLGVEIVPVKYDEMYEFNNTLNIHMVKLDGKFGLVDIQTGTELISPVYDYISALTVDIAKSNIGGIRNKEDIIMGGKWGLINSSGKEVVSAKYDYIYKFVEDLALVVKEGTYDPIKKNFVNGKYGYINKNGEEVLPPIYSEAGYFNQGLAKVTLNGESMRIDKTGKKFINEYKNICEAIYANDNDAIREMVKKGVDLNGYYKYKIKGQFTDEQSYPGYLLLNSTSNNNDVYELLKLFLDNGFNVKNDNVLCQIAYKCYPKKDKIKLIELLISKNVNINQQDYNGTNAIKYLCLRNCDCNDDIEIARLLLEHGADPTMKDMNGNNAIKTAKDNNCKELLSLLKSYKK